MIDSPWYVQLLRPQIFILAVTLSVIPLESITAQTAEKKETLKTENQVTELQLPPRQLLHCEPETRKKLSQRLISSLKSFRSRPLRCSPRRILCSVAANLQSHSCISMNISKLNPMPFLTSGREVSRSISRAVIKRVLNNLKFIRGVNPNDVENAAWHFLCLARADSFEKASSLVLPAPNDPRIPMEEVLKMLKSGDTSLVKNRINTVPESSGERARAEFYGFFYLGLFADAKGNQQEALQWLRKSAEDAPHHYMGDVARVYVQYLISELDGNK